MSLPTRSQIDWVKNTALLILSNTPQMSTTPTHAPPRPTPEARKHSENSYPSEAQYTLNPSDPETLCDLLYHLHTTHNILTITFERWDATGDVWFGCYSERSSEKVAIIRMRIEESEGPSEKADLATPLPIQDALEEVKISHPSIESESGEQSATTLPRIMRNPTSASIRALVGGIEDSTLVKAEKKRDPDHDFPIGADYERLDLRGCAELDDEWVDVQYPAGSNGWWRVRQRGKVMKYSEGDHTRDE